MNINGFCSILIKSDKIQLNLMKHSCYGIDEISCENAYFKSLSTSSQIPSKTFPELALHARMEHEKCKCSALAPRSPISSFKKTLPTSPIYQALSMVQIPTAPAH